MLTHFMFKTYTKVFLRERGREITLHITFILKFEVQHRKPPVSQMAERFMFITGAYRCTFFCPRSKSHTRIQTNICPPPPRRRARTSPAAPAVYLRYPPKCSRCSRLEPDDPDRAPLPAPPYLSDSPAAIWPG